MKLYKEPYGKKMTLGDHAYAKIVRAPDYHDGQMESLERRLDKATDVIKDLCDALAPAAQARLAEKWGLEEDGE